MLFPPSGFLFGIFFYLFLGALFAHKKYITFRIRVTSIIFISAILKKAAFYYIRRNAEKGVFKAPKMDININNYIRRERALMLVSCRYCLGLHSRGAACPNKPKDNRKKEETYISRFRSTKKWQDKRHEIKKRDKFLCQNCLINGTYVFNKLEVHHIYKVSEKWNRRLKNTNLITLCNICHKMADNGEIGKNRLEEIAAKNEANFYVF